MSDIPLTEIRHPLLTERNISLRLLREDLNHPTIGGNKWRKLKYNLEIAEKIGGVVSMGGAFSNHLYALSVLAKERALPFIALVRENEVKDNPTLTFIESQGAEIRYVDRSTFRQYRENSALVESLFPEHYFIPEGGSNVWALKGCSEIGRLIPDGTDVVTVPVGTGYTMGGIVNALWNNEEVIGFPALKEDYLHELVESLLFAPAERNWRLERGFHLGGIGEHNSAYVDFLNQFYLDYQLRLDPIYNGKMLYGLFQMISNNNFDEGSNIVAVITGGKQGIDGFKYRFPSLLNY